MRANRYTKKQTSEKYITWKKWHNQKKKNPNRRRNKRSEGHRRVLIATCRMRQPRSSAAKFKTFPEQEDRIKHSLWRILIFATTSPGGFRVLPPFLGWNEPVWSVEEGGLNTPGLEKSKLEPKERRDYWFRYKERPSCSKITCIQKLRHTVRYRVRPRFGELNIAKSLLFSIYFAMVKVTLHSNSTGSHRGPRPT